MATSSPDVGRSLRAGGLRNLLAVVNSSRGLDEILAYLVVEAMRSLERWLQWARRWRLDPFVALARTMTYYRADIEATLLHGVNNGRVESLNTEVRLIARRAFGFRSAQVLLSLRTTSSRCSRRTLRCARPVDD